MCEGMNIAQKRQCLWTSDESLDVNSISIFPCILESFVSLTNIKLVVLGSLSLPIIKVVLSPVFFNNNNAFILLHNLELGF